ncbi:MAG: aspartate ammonia-lyase [Candidatus Glassbacteria bacterium RIFCSPLOWO2_12_FULL_58_11]|uniref:Aspartate ammonia-lyase n=1 Tax=Candidatus Glassbacteria bacterium RIFCSPLOWO2_12_FULL_58_11 TaxID=1817867 RepID=A0A1F5YLH2_9BACT|nr:MAG: aspartate ammonia-lyase [Candidatus Glassbacteria bacterium RIFCSPLOWO2_12_FULL_58_11]
MSYRIEKDSLGEVRVPADKYWGAQTQRAVENFPVSGRTLPPEMTWAASTIKKAAALVHADLGLLEPKVAGAIAAAADRVIAGELDDNFVVDIYQAGAGTSFNMNVNEVLANLAEEALGGERGRYKLVSPNDQVNMGQSTNDVVPTAIRLACLKLSGTLIGEVSQLAKAFEERAAAFRDLVTTGRTHLQDAVPITLGQEFGGYGHTLKKCAKRLGTAFNRAGVLGLGGSAAGTGLNTHPEYQSRVIGVLRQLTGFELSADTDLFAAMSSMDVFVDIAARMKAVALELLKITNDLRLLASGPTSGLAEIRLPSLQPGSSIMPGKVNPVIPEMTAMVCFQVIGNEACVAFAAQAGQLQLNVMLPVIAQNVLESARLLTRAANLLNTKCVAGIEADPQRCREYFEKSLGTATVLNPVLGYLNTAEVVKESMRSGKSLKAIILDRKILTPEELERALDPQRITRPGILEKD